MPPRTRVPLLLVGAVLLASLIAPGAEAQSMRTQLRNVFHFGTCEDLICLSTSSGEHGTHYNPAAAEVAETLIDFLSNAIQTSIANVPLGATSSGTIFELDPSGIPIATSGSAGPVVGERSQTLGRSRLLIGANFTGGSFNTLRGVPLSDLALTLTHEDNDPPGLGNPTFERDTIHIATSLEASIKALSVYATYGLTNRIDIGVAVPIVSLDIDGSSIGTIVNTAGFPHHFWGGDFASPILVDTTGSQGSVTGIGDIAARIKFNLAQTARGGAAFLTEVRVPTGNQEDFLGSGSPAVRGLFVASARMGQMTPHVNAGFLWRGGREQNSAILSTVGFDGLVAPGLTIAADFLGQWQVGASRVSLPAAARYIDGSLVRRTNIPVRRDDLLGASLGAKYLVGGGFIAVANALLPLDDNGVRPSLLWTFALERSF
ncbi:MAG TPA: hypothetical protein VMM18_00570 [Gemmatimonadaceae bacterium]|nr:hypothetical protein [Gemmatimonadaceae bacterium]